MPCRTEPEEAVVEVYTDTPAHTDDHCLAIERFLPLLIMIDDVFCDEGDSFLGPDYGFESRPLRFEILFLLYLFPLGYLLELAIDLRALLLIEIDLGKPALVVDRDGGLVFDRPLDVIDADVVPEDVPGVLSSFSMGVPVNPMNLRAGGIPDMAGEPVDEVILATVGFVRDDDDVPAPVSSGYLPPFFSGKNFWIVVKTIPPDPTASSFLRCSRQLPDRFLPEDLMATRECAERAGHRDRSGR